MAVGGGGGGGGQPPSGNQPPPTNWGRYVPNEVVIEVASNVSPQTIAAMLRRHGLTQLEAINLQSSNTLILRLRINGRRSVPTVVRALAAEGYLSQPNIIATLQEASAAPAASVSDLEQYALVRMRMPEAHTLANGHRVLIAVIDGGVDTEHPELAGLILDTFDAIGTGDRVHPHGTSIVGAIAARARLRGTAPGAHILVARAFGTQRTSMDGTTTDILKAIDWAMQRGARVINMSFAGGRDPAIERRLNVARGRGIILVAAAGNAGPTSPALYPAAIPGVIAVTATDEDDRIYRSAVRGNHITIAAPGVNLMLPTVGGDYRVASGHVVLGGRNHRRDRPDARAQSRPQPGGGAPRADQHGPRSGRPRHRPPVRGRAGGRLPGGDVGHAGRPVGRCRPARALDRWRLAIKIRYFKGLGENRRPRENS